MPTLTIKNIAPQLTRALQAYATANELSLEEAATTLIRQALDFPKRDVSAFCGVWTEEEAAEFEEAIKIFDCPQDQE